MVKDCGQLSFISTVQFDVKQITQKDEEEFIGLSLITYSRLILKSPDAYEVLYLTLNG